MTDVWTPQEWHPLFDAIKDGACTPFLGAGACYPVLPLGSALADNIAQKLQYPFPDSTNLISVSQYGAVMINDVHIKRVVRDELKKRDPHLVDPLNVAPGTILRSLPLHRILSRLPFKLYLTTNYDDFLERAIEHIAQREFATAKCSWMPTMTSTPRRAPKAVVPSVSKPIVFHFHGDWNDLDSMVLTEDDYLEFLVNTVMPARSTTLPSYVTSALTASQVLFLGYSLEDITFKMLFRTVTTHLQRTAGPKHVAVQLKPAKDNASQQVLDTFISQVEYLTRKYNLQRVKVYWGSCEQFADELARHWDGYK